MTKSALSVDLCAFPHGAMDLFLRKLIVHVALTTRNSLAAFALLQPSADLESVKSVTRQGIPVMKVALGLMKTYWTRMVIQLLFSMCLVRKNHRNRLTFSDYKSCYTLCNETLGCGGVAYFTKFYPNGDPAAQENPAPMVCQLKTASPTTDPLCGNLEPSQAVSGRLCTDDPGTLR